MLTFGDDGPAPRVVRLDGGYVPEPIPPDYRPPPGTNSPQGMQRVLIEEPTDGWWTRAGAFGFRQTFDGPVPGENETISLTENLHLPGPPRVLWIHWFRYSRDLASEAINYGNWDLRGRVTYGVGGAQNVIECDVMSGVQMALVCNSVKVELVTYNPYVINPYDPGTVGFSAGAMFGDGGAGGALPPTWSTPVFQADGAGVFAADVIVPDFARSVVLHTSVRTIAAMAGITLYFGGPGGLAKVVAVDQAYAQLILEKGIALPAACNQVRIESLASANPERIIASYGLQFFLAL